jgi:hypothetical protein
MFKETALAGLFDIGGLIAGFMIAMQLGIFQLSPWAIALYPAVVSIKGILQVDERHCSFDPSNKRNN